MAVDYHAALTSFFTVYEPGNVDKVTALLAKNAGQEEAILEHFAKKYDTKFFAVRQRLIQLYEQHAPSKVGNVDLLLQKNPKKEVEVLQTLEQRFKSQAGGATQDEAASSPVTPKGGTTPPAKAGIDSRAALTAFYKSYSPDKVAQVDALLTKFKGHEEELMEKLDEKAGKKFFPMYKKIHAIISHYAPGNSATVDAKIVEKIAAGVAEEQLVQMFVTKFGEPPAGGTASSTAPASEASSPSATPSAATRVGEGKSGGAGQNAYADRIRRMYEKYDPSKVGNVEKLLAKYQEKEEELIAALVGKYGPEPEATKAHEDKGGGLPPAPPTDWVERIKAFYQCKEPSKVGNAEKVCAKYAGQEVEVWKKLVSQYGPEPYWVARLTRYLEARKPDAVPKVEGLLQKHAAQEEALLTSLIAKYGPEPELPSDKAPGATAGGTPSQDADLPAKAKVIRYYFHISPDKIDAAKALVAKYAGREDELYTSLVSKRGPDPFPPGPPAPTDWRTRLINFYATYCPEKLSTVDAILERRKGTEQEAMETLVSKYGPEPVPPKANPEFEKWKARLTAFYMKYNKDKVGDVPVLLSRNAGKEELVLQKLIQKYGPEPADIRGVVEGILLKWAPSQLSEVEQLISGNKESEETFIKALEEKYGAAPADEEVARLRAIHNALPDGVFEKQIAGVREVVGELSDKTAEEVVEAVLWKFDPRGQQTKQDEKAWADLPPDLRMVHEEERTARWDTEDSYNEEFAEFEKASESGKALAGKKEKARMLEAKTREAAKREVYRMWKQFLRAYAIAEEKRRQEALFQRMSIYNQIQTNKYSIEYYKRMEERREREEQKRKQRLQRQLQEEETQPRWYPKDFIALNVRNASVSPRARSPVSEGTSARRRRSQPPPPPTSHRPVEACSPVALNKVLSYQKKWMPKCFADMGYPAEQLPVPDYNRHRSSSMALPVDYSPRRLATRQRNRFSSRTASPNPHPPDMRPDGEFFAKTLQSMTGTPETSLEKAMRHYRQEQALSEGQSTWDKLLGHGGGAVDQWRRHEPHTPRDAEVPRASTRSRSMSPNWAPTSPNSFSQSARAAARTAMDALERRATYDYTDRRV